MTSEIQKPVSDNSNSLATMTDHYGSDISSHANRFKKVFKYYKRRVPPPDFSSVVDPSKRVEYEAISRQRVMFNCVEAEELDHLGLKPLADWVVVTLNGRSGLYILPNLLRDDAVEVWLRRMFMYAEPPNITNLTAHGFTYKKDFVREAGKSLRWATLGVPYDWETKKYPLEGKALPTELVQLSNVITKVLCLGTMHADAAIVNYYPPKSTLSPHVDRSERTDAPLISLSLGQSAVYLSGGVSLDDEILPLWLRSGDVLVMDGAQRFVYHAVAAISNDRRFNMKDTFLEEFANSSRVNITVRQVNRFQ